MEHALRLIENSIYTIIFCGAVTLLIHQGVNYQNLLTVIREYSENNEVLSTQGDYIQEESVDVITEEELIVSLFEEELEYDLQIDDLLISRMTHSRDLIESYGIKEGSYSKSYVYDSEGKISRVVYRFLA